MNNSIAAAGNLARPRVGARARTTARRILWILLICLLIATMVPSEGYLGAAYEDLAINRAIGGQGFRLAAWEVQAWRQKIADMASHPGAGLSQTQQHDLVVAYFARINRIDELNGAIQALYADPKQPDPSAAAAAMQAEVTTLRSKQTADRPAVEGILQSQVGDVLRSVGLLTSGVLWPPVLFHFSESPDVLIISPRDHIEMQNSAFVEPTVTVAQMEHMESQVEGNLGVSALVDGTGGFSTYPTMVVEYSSLPWVLSTIAHEWFHTYLVFQPLGWHYFDSGDTRTLNETAASIFGDELGLDVLRKFYPERMPTSVHGKAGSAAAPKAALTKFDFGATMRETRLKVDQMLKDGRLAEAEAYMEAQRKLIVDHGYMIRRLNQAYFAFHGSYAVGPTATDPIGDKLRALRSRTPSLLAFVQTIQGITTVEELDQAIAAGKQ